MDLALVCVKSFDTEEAGRTIAPGLAPGAVVLSLQNGVENPEVLTATCPGATVGGVAVYLGCQRIALDHVVRRVSRDPATGRIRDLLAGGGPGPAGDALVAVGAAIGVPTRVDERPEVALWTKLVANASLNTVTALGRANVGRVFSDPEAVELMLALGREVVAVAHALDVPVPDDTAEQLPVRRPPAPAPRRRVVHALRSRGRTAPGERGPGGRRRAGGRAAPRARPGEPRLRRPPGALGSRPPLGSH